MKRILSNITEEDYYLLELENIEENNTCFMWLYRIFTYPRIVYNRLYNLLKKKN